MSKVKRVFDCGCTVDDTGRRKWCAVCAKRVLEASSAAERLSGGGLSVSEPFTVAVPVPSGYDLLATSTIIKPGDLRPVAVSRVGSAVTYKWRPVFMPKRVQRVGLGWLVIRRQRRAVDGLE